MNALRLLLAGRWRQALATSLAVVALVGAIGGFVLASATAARRVDGSFRELLREIDAPDLIVRQACAESVFLFSECTAQGEPSAAGVALAELVALEFVQQARSVDGLRLLLIDDAGAPLFATSIDPSGCGPTGRYPKAMPLAAGGPRDQAVPFRLEGQLPTLGGSGVVLARSRAERTRLGSCDTIRIAGTCGLYSEVQRFGRSIDLVVTGLSIGPADVAAPSTGITPESLYVDPVVFESLQVRGAEPETEFTIWLDPTADAAIESLGLEPFEVLIDFNQRASSVDAALAVDARTLWLLAAIGVVGGILVLSPIVGRNIRATGPPTVTLSALGATQRQIAVQAAAHGATLAVVGAATASVLAIPLSAIMPRGRAAAILGDHPLSVDWLVIATGFGLTAVGVFVISCLPAWRISTARDARRRAGVQPTEVFLPALRVGPAARTGLQAAIGVSTGPRGSNPWASLLPLMLLATSGVASITYLAGLRHLERTPALVGWNWDAIVGFEEADSAQVRTAISRIAATEGVDQVTPSLSFPSFFPSAPDLGLSLIWPWTFATGRDAITPQMLTGRAPEGSDEVAIDPVFAKRTGVNVGDVIPLTRPSLEVLVRDEIQVAAQELGLPVPHFAEVDDEQVAQIFEVTGIAVLPLERSTSVAQAAFTLDGFWSLAPSAAEITALRVWLPADLDPQLLRRVEEMLASVSNTEVSGAFVRYSGDEAAIHRALARIDGVSSVLAPAPADVWRAIGINLDRADRIPVSLAITVAGLFIALVAFHLFAAVRARRFEFAVMRALGMSTSGVCRSVAVQATITALVVVVVAIPAGVLVGRWAWLTNARDLDVEQIPVIPWIATASVGVGAVVIASVAALSVGWPAIRRTPATDLRFE